jgi:hypothetical protein
MLMSSTNGVRNGTSHFCVQHLHNSSVHLRLAEPSSRTADSEQLQRVRHAVLLDNKTEVRITDASAEEVGAASNGQ